MAHSIRDLEQTDMDQVNSICATTWGGNDYIPEVLPYWIESPNYIVRGLFHDTELLSICALHVASSDTGYISGLRTKGGRRREGHAKTLTEALMATAKEKGVKHLLYLTISFNEASIGLAKDLGFCLIEQYGFFHLYAPLPTRPTPSPLFVPISADPERVHDVIRAFPTLIPHDYLPFDFQFYQKSLSNLQYIAEHTDFQIVIDENGRPGGLYYSGPLREDRGERATSYVMYTTNRAIFVDMMARIVDEIDTKKATRITFLMGPNATQWVADLGYTNSEIGAWPGEYSERRLLLYELQFQDERS